MPTRLVIAPAEPERPPPLPPAPPADLSLTVEAPADAVVGDATTLRLIVANAGPNPAPAATVLHELPPSVVSEAVSPGQGHCLGSVNVVCTLGTIPAGGQAVVEHRVRFLAPAAVTTVASAEAASADHNFGDNRRVTTFVVAATRAPAAEPPPPPAQPEPICTVPRVRGLTLARATAALERAGCSLGVVSRARSRTVPRGRVVSQRPAAGAQVADGTPVDLVLSRGP